MLAAMMVMLGPVLLMVGASEGTPASAAGAVIFEDGFDGAGLNPGAWTVVTGGPISPQKSQAYLLADNVRVEGGLLKIATRRHCVPTGQQPGVWNESRTSCGANTRYSAGRVQGLFRTPPGAAFEIRISAQMPTNGSLGTRGALWAKNGQPYCNSLNPPAKTNLGELDLLEWHPDQPNVGQSTTHMSCSGSLADPEWRRWETERDTGHGTFDDNHYYEWIVQREGNWVSYFVRPGGGPEIHIESHVCGVGEFGFTQSRCDLIMNDPFGLILQSEVFVAGGYGNHPGPEVNTYLDANWMHIDWVRISYLR
ncbi:MAG TPA: hypothetical protein VGD67_16800 [Pseudonocardiaceae bacterium]